MTATFAIHESNGTQSTGTSVATNINFGSTDAANLVVATYPITAGDHSYEKYERCYFSGAFNKIENLQIWKSAGVYKTSEAIYANMTTSGYSNASFAQPTSADSSKATIAMPTADPGAANMGLAGTLAGNITTTGYSDFWVLQTDTGGDTPPGDVNQKTFTIQYDES
jgi:hypothetical protein